MNPPTQEQLTAAGLAPIPNLYAEVGTNGKKVRAWNGKNFVVVTQAPFTQQLYAVPGSWEPPVVTPPITYPIAVGSNTAMIDYGVVAPQLAACQSMGMTWVRDNVPWNFTQGSFTGIEAVLGTYSTANAAHVASVVATYKTYGLRPLLVVTVNKNPGLDSTWTPQAFASMMGWLVAQPGLQGIDWELFNEPDGEGVGVPYALLVQAYKLAYPAMKAADPACTIHGLVLQGLGPAGYGPETYYDNCVTAGILSGGPGPGGAWYDVFSAHIYFLNSNGTTNDLSPLASGGGNTPWPLAETVANFQANRLAKGDKTKMMITEFGWNSTGDGVMTPALQAQYYSEFFTALNALDTVNNVPFSEYVIGLIQYAIGNGAANWGIYQQPAQAVITALLKGTS